MRRFGIIGRSLGHSFSPSYFSEKFASLGLAATYQAFELNEAGEIMELIKSNPDLEGLNVTIPFKEDIIPYLNQVSPAVDKIGAVNTISIRSGKLEGFNTDVIGFENTLESLGVASGRALILGTGGAQKAVAYVLRNRDIQFETVSRSSEGDFRYIDLDKDMLQAHNIIVNTTPLGMWPDVDSCPQIPFEYVGNRHVLIDLVYEPRVTKFLQNGLTRGARVKNGFEMLIEQAEASWKIWNRED